MGRPANFPVGQTFDEGHIRVSRCTVDAESLNLDDESVGEVASACAAGWARLHCASRAVGKPSLSR